MALAMVRQIITGVEYVGMEIGATTTRYEGKLTGIVDPLVRARVMVNSLADLPPRIPKNIQITKGERGVVLKDYKVKWDVEVGMPKEIPRPRELINDTVKAITGG